MPGVQDEDEKPLGVVCGAYEHLFDGLDGYYLFRRGDSNRALCYIDATQSSEKALEAAHAIAANPLLLDAPGRFTDGERRLVIWDLRHCGGECPMPRFIYGMAMRLLGDEQESPIFACPFDERLFSAMQEAQKQSPRSRRTAATAL